MQLLQPLQKHAYFSTNTTETSFRKIMCYAAYQKRIFGFQSNTSYSLTTKNMQLCCSWLLCFAAVDVSTIEYYIEYNNSLFVPLRK